MPHAVDIEALIKDSKLPKLPHQDEFILHLYNNNYSPETIYNYHRDLTFFAAFLAEKNLKFSQINKLTITYYKGWLKKRKHIKALQRLRGDTKPVSEGGDEQKTTDKSSGVETEANFRTSQGTSENTDTEGGSGAASTSEKPGKALKSGAINPNFKGGYVKNNNPEELDANSINRILVSLRNFLRFLVEYDYPTPLPSDAVTLIRQPRKKPQVPSLEEVIALVEAPSKFEPDPLIAARNRAMLETLLATGMRISELVSLNRDQLNDEGKLFITGKGRKQRLVYLTPRAMRYIREYLLMRKDPYPAMFVPTSGRRLKKSDPRISTNYVQMKIAEYRRLLGIVVPISAHTIRHAFATYLAENGANPAAIQVLLGHESLQTTTRYVHASDKFAEQTHRKYHPVR